MANGSGTVSGAINNANVTCTRNASQYAYVLNSAGNSGAGTVSVYSMALGVMTPLGGSPTVPTGIAPSALAVDPTGNYVYVANQWDGTVSAYMVNAASGALSALNGFVPVATGTTNQPGPTAIALDPSGSYAFVLNYSEATVSSYKVVNHALTLAGTTVTTNNNLTALAVDPTGTYVYAVASDDYVWVFTILKPSGQLSAGTSYALSSGLSPAALVMAPGGGVAYTANAGSPVSVGELVFNSNGGGLVGTATSAADTGARSVAVDPNGKFLLVMNADANSVMYFALDPLSGAPGAGVATALGLLGVPVDSSATITLDSTGAFAYTTNQADHMVHAFAVNTASGTLTSLGAVATPWPNSAVAATPTAIAISTGPH